jgi:hypothetical protein
MNAKIFNHYNMDDNTIGVYIFLVHMDDNKIFQLEIGVKNTKIWKKMRLLLGQQIRYMV